MKRERSWGEDYGIVPTKRKYTRKTPTNTRASRRRYKRRYFRPGYDRTGGFYKYSRRLANGIERKFWDVALAWSFDATGEVVQDSLIKIPQGDTQSTRDGLRFTVTSIHIRGYILGASDQPSDILRMILYLDRQANGAIATEILTATTTLAFNDLANSSRFLILKDWFVGYNVMASVGNAATFPNQVIPIKYNKKCNIPVFINNTDGALTGIKTNNLGIYACGLNDDKTSFAGVCRIRFIG